MLQIIHTTDPRHINSPLSAQATNAHVDGTDASGTTLLRSKGSRPMHALECMRPCLSEYAPTARNLKAKQSGTSARRSKHDAKQANKRGANKAPRIRSRRPSASRGSWPRCGSRSGRAWTRHTCGGKGYEEVDETSSGLLQPARATSHDVDVRAPPASMRHLDSHRWLAAANVPVKAATSTWSWPAPTTLHARG